MANEFLLRDGDLTVARYCQAADIYIQAARGEVWGGQAITEALARGAPVVARAVGGIPEQVKGLEMFGLSFANSDVNSYGMHEATDVLVHPGDAEAIAADMSNC